MASRQRSSKAVTINAPITFQINAKDVSSFNASKDQIMRDMHKALNRAVRRLGEASDIDDPTKL